MTTFVGRSVSKPAPAILVAMLLSAPAAGHPSVGVARAAAATTVTVSIPSLYGISMLEQDSNPAESAGVRLASSGRKEADPPGVRLAVVSTAGEGKIALRRLVLLGASASEDGFRPAGNRTGREKCSESSDVFFFPTSSFGWKNLEDRVSPARLARASRGGPYPVATVVYELWQF